MGISEVFTIGAIAGSATALGGLLAFILPVQKNSWLLLSLGFAGGVMTGLSLFQLMPEGYFFAESLFPPAFGFSVGILFMALLSFITGTANLSDLNDNDTLRKTGLFICLSLALHNFPEGVAIGVGFSGANSLGFLIAFAMLLHNIPEGIGIGVPLRKSGSGIIKVLCLTLAAGFMTPVGAIIGRLFGTVSASMLGWALGLAAGAMIFVSFSKLLFRGGYWNHLGAFCGILLTFLIA